MDNDRLLDEPPRKLSDSRTLPGQRRPPSTDDNVLRSCVGTVNWVSMQYAHILALIDADLERLKKVRLLLTTLDTPPKETQKRARNPPVRAKTLRTAERQKPAAPALQIDDRGVSQRKNARPAMKLKKPVVGNLGAASLAKAPAPAASKSALILDDQIRQEHPQGQRAAQVVEESAFGQLAPIPLVARVPTQRKRRAVSKLSVTPLATPLGGLVPTGPIFIPADQIRQKQSQSRQESVMERGASSPSAIVPLTAELLTRRWIRSLV